jgi:SAM-dependent methyltransferase
MTTTHHLPIHPANRAQLQAWDGDEGEYWAEHADEFDRSVARYQGRLLQAAAIEPTDRVLDIGCGSGQTSRDAARRAFRGSVLGLDLSAAMLDTARRAAAADGLRNVRFEQADAQVHPFDPDSADVVLSRTGGTFFADLVAAWTNIGRALRPHGRMALLTWQPVPANEWISEIGSALAAGRPIPLPPPGMPGPFAFGDPDVARDVLTTAGFESVALTPLAEPMWFGHDAEAAVPFILGVSGWMLGGLDDDARARALAALRWTVEAHSGDGGVEFGSAMWLVTARRAG